MAAAETAKLVASLDLKDNLSAGVAKASGSLKKLESTSFKVGQGIGRLARVDGMAVVLQGSWLSAVRTSKASASAAGSCVRT